MASVIQSKIVAARSRLGGWFDGNASRLGYATAGLLLGLIGGWWAGSYLACSETTAGCEVRPDSIGAAGTWFGAIGTIAAVLTAVAAFRSDERTKREASRRAQLTHEAREQLERDEASMVRVSVEGYHTQAGRVLSYRVTVVNGADTTPIFRLRGHDFTGALKGEHEVAPGKSSSTDRRMGTWQAPPESRSREEFESWCLKGVSVSFKMNDRFWRREGTGEVEPLEAHELD